MELREALESSDSAEAELKRLRTQQHEQLRHQQREAAATEAGLRAELKELRQTLTELNANTEWMQEQVEVRQPPACLLCCCTHHCEPQLPPFLPRGSESELSTACRSRSGCSLSAKVRTTS